MVTIKRVDARQAGTCNACTSHYSRVYGTSDVNPTEDDLMLFEIAMKNDPDSNCTSITRLCTTCFIELLEAMKSAKQVAAAAAQRR